MKKSLLLVSALLMGGSAVWGQSQRLVLVEEFTQASCGPCASANPALQALLNSNVTKATSIKYQTSWPGTDPMNAQNKPDVQTRVTYTGAGSVGVPYAVMDGAVVTGGGYNGAPGGLTQTKINTEYAIASPFTMQLMHWFNAANDSIFIQCKITCTQNVTMTTPKFQVAMIEKTISFTTAPGSNGEKKFYNVMRKMYPNASGTALATTWTNGQTQTLNFKDKIPTYIYQKSEIATVAWIQDDGNKNIKQAAYNPAANTTTGINNVVVENSLSVYPNPSRGEFTTSFEAAKTDNYTVKITNTLGQVVYQEELANFAGTYSKKMDIGSYGEGVYLLVISNGQNENVKKVITY